MFGEPTIIIVWVGTKMAGDRNVLGPKHLDEYAGLKCRVHKMQHSNKIIFFNINLLYYNLQC